MTTKQGNYRTFDALPEGWTFGHVEKDGTVTNKADPFKWSNESPPPAIGTKVTVRMNDLGPGVIAGYFVEYGWLGVLVKLSNPPAWWKKQNANDLSRRAHIFGTELSTIQRRET